MSQKPKSKEARDLETRCIVYGDRSRPDARHQELKVDVRCCEEIDKDHAAAMVAVRTTLALADVKIIKITI